LGTGWDTSASSVNVFRWLFVWIQNIADNHLVVDSLFFFKTGAADLRGRYDQRFITSSINIADRVAAGSKRCEGRFTAARKAGAAAEPAKAREAELESQKESFEAKDHML
jgi:hypothetical protein